VIPDHSSRFLRVADSSNLRMHTDRNRRSASSGRRCAAFGVIVHPSKPRCMIRCMQLATGTVVDGKIVVDGDPLPEGATVTILAREADETFEVPSELEPELLESLAQAARGETISAEEMLERLRRIA
jgi:hypothetical protein